MSKSIALGLCLALAACTKLPLQKSWPMDANQNATTFNKTYKLNYQVYNNQEFLKLIFSSSHIPTNMKILRKGAHVYFDLGGKKSKEQFINYPIASPQKASNEQQGDKRRGRPSGNRSDKRKMDLNRVLDRVPKKVIMNLNNQNDSFTLSTLPKGFEINVAADSSFLSITYTIPIQSISSKGAEGLKELSVGFMSGFFDMPVSTGNAANERAGAPPFANEAMAEMADPVKVWFKVDINQ